ncbi:MAG TPA: histidine--tRNA ligase [Stellaceae bacterium]|jgi:histidyl-tRNA synthetase|nr:histidine--tRNA ligase [Stellaceae bacterium]
MAGLQPVRGTQDLLPDTHRRHRAVVETARAIAERYGFQEIATPIFEFTEVFARPIGETSDIVSKEMYTFADRGGEEITLRPEYTAGIVRAVLSNGLTQSLPLKFFAAGPMFRYERPQKGRFRQFHQIDVELIGAAQPAADVELIALAADILDELGVLKDTVLELNTLGDTTSRAGYRAALVEYYGGKRAGLSEDSLRRLETNPLRILDSKDENDQRINAEAPSFAAYLTAEAKHFFDAVCAGLATLRISYRLNPRLVRGLDYYCHTAFEFVTTSLGAQGTVLGGGRYDGLMGVMGGPETPGVGWAAGIERLALLIDEPSPPPRPIALVPLGAQAEMVALQVAQSLRRAEFHVELGYSGNLSRRMRHANKIKACAAVIIGDDEIAREAVALRDLDSGEQIEVPLRELTERLARYR